ncbi:MAG: hypothetical protein ACUZ8E_01810 [Candidatus Anammoxibacter sp.]
MFNESNYLTKEEITKERTAKEYCNWVESKMLVWKQLRTSDPDGSDLHNAIILGRGIFNDFYTEVVPFCRYLQVSNQDLDNLQVKILLDSNKHYDAIIIQNKKEVKLEITKAFEDRHDIRMELFLNNGHVNVTGRMQSCGTRQKGRKVKIDEDMVAQLDLLKEVENLVNRRVARKTKDRTLNQNYSSDTNLIVVIDDYVLGQNVYHILNDSFSTSIAGTQDVFMTVFIVGISGKLFLKYPRNNKN